MNPLNPCLINSIPIILSYTQRNQRYLTTKSQCNRRGFYECYNWTSSENPDRNQTYLMTTKELLNLALEARMHSYSPYSNFEVGAALLAKSGVVYLGCNIESAAYPAAICAERTAFSKAVSGGCREFDAIAIAGAPKGRKPDGECVPCGVCRQVMAEFCRPDFKIVLGTPDNHISYALGDLLPKPFGPGSLGKA